MSSNKNVKHQLQFLYGKGCMFRKAQIAERIEQMGGIKTYKKFVQETHYKRRKIHTLESRLTLHHLQHQSEGGPTTVNNGAVINELAHRYLHSLPRDEEEIINEMLRHYKYKIKCGILVPTDLDIQLQQPDSIDLDFNLNDEDVIVIPVYDTEKEDYDKKFNRAKYKRETQKIIDEELYDEDEFELD